MIDREHEIESNEVMTLCLAASAVCVNNQQRVAQCTRTFITHEYNLSSLYEALLQSYLFAGFPAALEAFSTFRRTLDESDCDFTPPKVECYDVENFKKRGEQTCEKIYTSVYASMRARLGALSPQLDEWMIVEGYGKTLTRPQLDLQRRELINVAMLATTGWERQLYSHIRGARSTGASHDEICEAIRCALWLKGDEVFSGAMRVLEEVENNSVQNGTS